MSEAARRIDDAGEKIEGARKDWKARAMGSDDLEAMTDDEIVAEVRKDHVWPKPDWKAAVEAGMDPMAAACVKIIRDRLAQEPRPQRNWTAVEVRKAFVEMTALLRDSLMACRTVEEVREVYGTVRSLFPFPLPARERSGLVFFSVYKGRACPFGVAPGDLTKARRMVDEGFPDPVPAWRKGVLIKQDEDDGTYFLVKNHRILQDGFPDEEEALAWLERKKPEGKPAAGKGKGPVEPSRPHLDRIAREGLEDHRGGRDVSPEEFIETFGFRGVQFGLWLPDGERQAVLNHGYDACMDLADVLGWEPKALSLEGTLAVAFGARGKGGKAAAHYEPGQRVVNMTRISGAGSFAHEFAHALDHWLGTGGTGAESVPSASGWRSWTRDRTPALGHRGAGVAAAWNGLIETLLFTPMTREEEEAKLKDRIARLEGLIAENARNMESHRKLDPRRQNRSWLRKANLWAREQSHVLVSLKKTLRQVESGGVTTAGRRQSNFFAEASKLSGSGDYWKRPTEMFARAFESWVFDELETRQARSDYLVHGVEPERFEGTGFKGNPYPSGSEREAIGKAVTRVVDAAAPLLSPRWEKATAP